MSIFNRKATGMDNKTVKLGELANEGEDILTEERNLAKPAKAPLPINKEDEEEGGELN
jgi:hypothetical protein